MIAALHFVIGCATHSPYVKYGLFRCSPIPRAASTLMFALKKGVDYCYE